MAVHDFDPFCLDVAAFAKAAAQLAGRWPLAQLDRLHEAAFAEVPTPEPAEVTWRVRGEARSLRDGNKQIWLHLGAATALAMECQRCLKAVELMLQIERSFLFVHGEDAAAQLDSESDDDVLALTRALDLRELIEDELLLAMPLVPRHEACPEPLPIRPEHEETQASTNPFASLAALKPPGSLN